MYMYMCTISSPIMCTSCPCTCIYCTLYIHCTCISDVQLYVHVHCIPYSAKFSRHNFCGSCNLNCFAETIFADQGNPAFYLRLFAAPNFRGSRPICEKRENYAPRTFGAIQYVHMCIYNAHYTFTYMYTSYAHYTCCNCAFSCTPYLGSAAASLMKLSVATRVFSARSLEPCSSCAEPQHSTVWPRN